MLFGTTDAHAKIRVCSTKGNIIDGIIDWRKAAVLPRSL
jgi:hypothetical protein